MRIHHLLTVACLGTSVLLFAAQSFADTPMPTMNGGAVVAAMPTLPPAIAAKDLNSDKSVEKAFKNLSEGAMKKNGFDNLVGYLVDQDRDRIKKSTDKSLSDLDGDKNKGLTDIVASLDTAWKAKYNQKFDIDHVEKVYTSDFLHILTGEVTDPALLVGKWPVDPGVGVHSGTVTPKDVNEAKKMFGGEVKLEKGRKVAIAQLAMRHGLPAINASLIHEAFGWKFDIPNTINAQQLYDNLVSNLTYLNTHRDIWPADIHEADGLVSHSVVAALYGLDLQKMTKESTANER